MIIKFHQCTNEEFNIILLNIKCKEIEIIEKFHIVPFVSLMVSRKILIIHDLVAMKLIYELLLDNLCFGVVCSIIHVKRRHRGGHGMNIVNNIEDRVFSVNKYNYELINFKDELYYYSELYGVDEEFNKALFSGEFNLKLVIWDLLFLVDDISFAKNSLIFFKKLKKYQKQLIFIY